MAVESDKLTLNLLALKDIHIGDVYSFTRMVDEKLIDAFAEVSGDYNPLHMDAAFAERTQFGGRIAHGMLAVSFFSALVGMLIPGRDCLYLSQEVRFRKPILINTTVTVEGVVTDISEAARVITVATKVKDAKGIVLVEGKAQVKINER